MKNSIKSIINNKVCFKKVLNTNKNKNNKNHSYRPKVQNPNK